MSIETDLNSIAKSLATIAAHLTAPRGELPPVTPAVPEAKAPVVEVPKPVVSVEQPLAPSVNSGVTVATTATVVTASPTSTAPFDSAASLTAYVMNAYKTLGPIKGAKIQEVLQSVGAKNINEVKPEQYITVKAGVDALGV